MSVHGEPKRCPCQNVGRRSFGHFHGFYCRSRKGQGGLVLYLQERHIGTIRGATLGESGFKVSWFESATHFCGGSVRVAGHLASLPSLLISIAVDGLDYHSRGCLSLYCHALPTPITNPCTPEKNDQFLLLHIQDAAWLFYSCPEVVLPRPPRISTLLGLLSVWPSMN